MEKAYFTLRENGNEECPNMGTIGIEYWGKLEHNGMEFYNKIREVILTHFDMADELVTIVDDIEFHLVFNSYPMEFTVEVDGEDYACSIEQTFLY
jgi:hypothetical protein|tara:strand:+ start:1925 stop:2209 length:285 start_codon:yes stop_codon:yes gene_type:complete